MTAFRERVARCAELPDGACEIGLRALRGPERERIRPVDSRALQGSVDLDTHLKGHPVHSRSSRWDYAIGYGGDAWFVEFHEVTDRAAGEVQRKAEWLSAWLAGPGRALGEIATGPYCWVATGSVPPTRYRRKVLAMAQRGVRMVGSSMTLPPGR